MKKIFSTLIALFFLLGVNAQASLEFAKDKGETVKDIPTQLAERITAEDLKSRLTLFASKEFQGRGVGKEGQKKATDYLRNFYNYKRPDYQMDEV